MFVGGSQAILRVQELIDKAARSGSTVLIIGESGVGKEIAANEIHKRSGRPGRFVARNCANFAESLIESELFGHERGAFTGAAERRKGIFEQADGGTVFLDEVTEMKPELQAKLLRVLENLEIVRVGGQAAIPVKVRVIAASNRSPEEAVAENPCGSRIFVLGLPRLTRRIALRSSRQCPEQESGSAASGRRR